MGQSDRHEPSPISPLRRSRGSHGEWLSAGLLVDSGMALEHKERILDQFTRQAVPFFDCHGYS
jgi:hypothetical protein